MFQEQRQMNNFAHHQVVHMIGPVSQTTGSINQKLMLHNIGIVLVFSHFDLSICDSEL